MAALLTRLLAVAYCQVRVLSGAHIAGNWHRDEAYIALFELGKQHRRVMLEVVPYATGFQGLENRNTGLNLKIVANSCSVIQSQVLVRFNKSN